MFSHIIGAEWKPSNIGLDDVVLGGCAWGAKTVKAPDPVTAKSVRLVSGRNSPSYSFNKTVDSSCDASEVGELVLGIWNGRVELVKKQFSEVRTIVLVKSDDLTTLAAFEFETTSFPADKFSWSWNKNGNLVGHDNMSGILKFTWQPHGSQFTISESVPESRLAIRINKIPHLSREQVFDAVNFDPNWIEVL
jgi:hypothetical protein